MTRALLLLVPALLLVACKSNDTDDTMTDEQRAELQKIVDRRLAEVSKEVSLSQTQLDSIKPAVVDAKRKLVRAANEYRNNPNANTADKYTRRSREIGIELRKTIQPMMTNAQLNQFMVVIDRVIQDVRAARGEAARGG